MIFKNKIYYHGTITRNKARLFTQEYQEESIDFDETSATIARLKSIKILFSMASTLGFKLYQMDIKSAFLNEIFQENAYIEKPKGFVDPKFPCNVYRLKKALYRLKQTPRTWYYRLTACLLEHGFLRGGADRTLFIRYVEETITITQIYVDDIFPIDVPAYEFVECMKQDSLKWYDGRTKFFP